LPQVREIIQTLAAGRIQDDKTLYIAGFIQTALALLEPHMALHAARQIQAAERLQQQRHAGQKLPRSSWKVSDSRPS
jgi:hypothetical protein